MPSPEGIELEPGMTALFSTPSGSFISLSLGNMKFLEGGASILSLFSTLRLRETQGALLADQATSGVGYDHLVLLIRVVSTVVFLVLLIYILRVFGNRHRPSRKSHLRETRPKMKMSKMAIRCPIRHPTCIRTVASLHRQPSPALGNHLHDVDRCWDENPVRGQEWWSHNCGQQRNHHRPIPSQLSRTST